jgi:hypothetical protein
LVFINNFAHLVQELMLGDGASDEIVLKGSLIEDGGGDGLLNQLLD